MKHTIRAAVGLLSVVLLGSACVRPNPLYSGPDFNFRGQAKEWELGKKYKGSLDPKGSDAWAQSVRYTLPAKGSLLLTVKASNGSATLNIDIYSSGKTPIASTEKASDKKLAVPDLEPDTYYVRVFEDWKSGEETSFDLLAVYKPADPDEDNKEYKSQAGARELPFDKPTTDTVDYSARKRTHWWKITLAGQGGLNIKFENKDKDKGAHIDAYLVDPNQGAPIAIDPTVGWKKDDLAAGDYFVKVEAKDAGDAGQYELKASYKQGDVCKNGGDPCTFSGAEELKLPADNKKSDVDYTKGKAFHFYVIHLKDKGKLTLDFKSETKGSKVVAQILKKEDDEPEVFKGSVTKDVADAGDLFIKVAANEPGDAGKYVLKSVFVPVNVAAYEVLEIGTPCYLTVQGGSNQGVKTGAACSVINSSGAVIDSCMIDQIYPNLSKIRPMGSCSKIPKQGSKVQIQQQ